MNPLFRDMAPKMPLLAVQSLTARNALGLDSSAEGQVNNLIRSGTAGLKQTVTTTSANTNSLQTSLNALSKRVDELASKIQESDLTVLQARISVLEVKIQNIEKQLNK